jgi:short-subunit dehydrogenase
MKSQKNPQTVLVTGGSSGIGKELSRLLYLAGYRLLVVSLLKQELEILEKEFRQIDPSGFLKTLQQDLTASDSTGKILKWISKLGYDVDILVNNAGFGLWGKSWELSSDKVESMLQLNIIAVTQLSAAFAKRMSDRKKGFILNVASTASLQPLPYMAAYAASKAYVVSFSEALSEELADSGVKVGIFYPGTTRTNFLTTAGIHKEKTRKGSLGNLAHSIAMDPQKVANIAFRAIQKERKKTIPGFMNILHYYSTKLFPAWIVKRIAGKVFQKQ